MQFQHKFLQFLQGTFLFGGGGVGGKMFLYTNFCCHTNFSTIFRHNFFIGGVPSLSKKARI